MKTEIAKPQLIYASPNLMPIPKVYVTERTYAIDKHQAKGINLMLTHFLEKKGKGFLLADGTGVGKTRQILGLANEMKKRLKKPVLIVTENKTIIAGSFRADAIAMKLSPTLFEMGTYSDIRLGKIGKKKYGCVIFDEAHNLKNATSQQTVAANSIVADHKVFATATPLDTILGAAYFVSEVTNMTPEQIYFFIGFKLTIEQDKDTGKVIKKATLLKGMDNVAINNNLVKLRNKIIKDGAMVRREYPFWGDIKTITIPFSTTQQKEETQIVKYWSSQGNSLAKAGQRSGELSRWNELQKLEYTIAATQNQIKNGKSVVVVAEVIENTDIYGLGTNSIEKGTVKTTPRNISGFIGEFARRAKKTRTPIAQIYGKANKPAEVEAFQLGKVKIAIATPRSGGTGINLDDTIGNAPRVMYFATPNYSGNQFQQILGRISRRNTKTPSMVYLLYTPSISDKRRKEIVDTKLGVLRAIQKGTLAENQIADLGEGNFLETQRHTLIELAANDNNCLVDVEIIGDVIKMQIKGKLPAKAYIILKEKYPNASNVSKEHYSLTWADADWIFRLSSNVCNHANVTTTTTTKSSKEVVTEKIQTKQAMLDLFGNTTTNTTTKKTQNSWYQSKLF